MQIVIVGSAVNDHKRKEDGLVGATAKLALSTAKSPSRGRKD
ncbi:unnamed protein product [Cylicostephanus goldi]|uniref:Uncharacterized protein n=1 Tax=Cylicostephanus goldi TaxID=71465 RepID=A0A3P6QRC9_CYLGO|nr:unnamed protein product [Cylicostephanus goldi]